MKRERPHETAFKEWAGDMLGLIAASIVVTKNAANEVDIKTVTHTVTDVAKCAFKAGWDAAFGWCMQPEEEVPAGTAIPSEHTSNTSGPIVASAEGTVNA